MTKAQIKQITAESARLVEQNRAGVPALRKQYLERIAELREKRRSRQSGSNERASSYSIAACARD